MDSETNSPRPESLEFSLDHTASELSLPYNLPSRLISKLAWTAIEDEAASECIYHLTEQDHLEIDAALGNFFGEDVLARVLLAYSANVVADLELHGDAVCCTNFPLPNLQHKLRWLSMQLCDGPGYIVVRGLRINTYSAEDTIIIWLGIQSYIAETRLPQDEINNMLGEQPIIIVLAEDG